MQVNFWEQINKVQIKDLHNEANFKKKVKLII